MWHGEPNDFGTEIVLDKQIASTQISWHVLAFVTNFLAVEWNVLHRPTTINLLSIVTTILGIEFFIVNK